MKRNKNTCAFQKVILIFILAASCLTAQEPKRIYTGLRLGGGIGMVYPVGDAYYYFFSDNKDPYLKWRDGGSFDIAPFVSLQLVDKFALQTEVMITRFGYWGEVFEYDEGGITEIEKLQISRAALLFPILAKYTLRKNRFNFQLYTGPHFTANVGKYRYYLYFRDGNNEEKITIEKDEFHNELKIPPIGYMLGTNFGFISTKAGTVFVDVRFLGDMGVVKEDANDGYGWWPYLYRAKLSITLGWEMGFVNR